MKRVKSYLILVSLLSLTYCTKGPKPVEIICEYQSSIDRFSDSTYISASVEEITDYKSHFYISDVLNGRFVILDSNYNLIKSIGSHGNGPGEFMLPASSSFYKDSIYIIDFQKKVTSVFTSNGIYSRDIFNKDTPEAIGFRLPDNGNYLMSTCFLTEPISLYDLSGNRIKGFGRIVDKYAVKGNRLLNLYNKRNLQIIDNKLIVSVFRSQPIIEVYDINGNLLFEKDIMSFSQVKDLYSDRDIKTMKGTFLIFRSILVKNNKLFILASHQYNNDYVANIIMEFEINEKDAEYKNFYTLEREKGEPSSYSCFNFNGNNIVAYNERNRALDIYKIVKK